VNCTNLRTEQDNKEEQGDTEELNLDVYRGITERAEPKNHLQKINRETIIHLFKQIPTWPNGQDIISKINSDIRELINKREFILDADKKELSITRIGNKEPDKIPILDEWNLLSPGERIIIILFILIHYLQRMKSDISTKKNNSY